jgi:hypothetical protein
MLPVSLESLRLNIGCTWPTFHRAFVVIKPCPPENFDEIFQGTFDIATAVGVFDSQDECAAVLSRKKKIVEGSAESTDMEIAGRTWGKADTHFRCFSHGSEWKQKVPSIGDKPLT